MTHRAIDTNGWAEIRDNPLSKVGVFPYLGRSIGAPEPDRVYMVYRPEEELSHPDCIESFRLLPWVDEHEMLGDEKTGYTAPETKGIHGVIGEDVYYEGGVLKGNIKVFSESLAALIQNGKRELSAGYRCQYEFTTGQYNGQHYDAIQRTIRGNHLASVKEGRMGPDVAVLDHMRFTFDAKELFMADEKNPVAQDEDVSLAEVVKQLIPLVQTLVGRSPPTDDEAPPGPNQTPVEDDDTPPSMEEEDENEEETEDEEEKKEDEETSQAMDAAIQALRTASKSAPKAMRKNMDRAITRLCKVCTHTQSNQSHRIISTIDTADIRALRVRLEQLERQKIDAPKCAELANRLSAHIGAFDHADKTLDQIARYGIAELGIRCHQGHEMAALDGYLHARAAPKPGSKQPHEIHAAVSVAKDIKNYLQGA